jgi:hypothetical protein
LIEAKYNKIWETKLKKNKVPRYFRKLRNIDFKKLKNFINDKEFCEKIINNLLKGDIYTFDNAINKNIINLLKRESKKLTLKKPLRNTRCYQGIKNFYYQQKDDQSKKGGYRSIDNSYYFFPWDKKSSNIFKKINPIWRKIKILSGSDKNQFFDNQPKDKIINRVHVIQYVKGGGMISPHSDPFKYSKIQIGCILSTRGKDYHNGGFAVFNKNKKEVLLDQKIKKGSLICFFPSLIHCVKPIDKNYDQSLESNIHQNQEGRWYMSLTTVGTDHMKNREKAKKANL